MKLSKETLILFDKVINTYAQYDHDNSNYYIDIDHVSLFDLNELAACIMLDDYGFAAESTSADNPNFYKYMLPAAIKFMRNTLITQNRTEFTNAWEDGIRNYFKPAIEEILQDRITTYGHFKKYDVE